jgi:nitrite reductase/ring-hydroxylating ferredoxin subunit
MVTMQQTLGDDWHALCRSTDLENGGLAVPFDIVYQGQTCRAFAIRFQDEVRAYVNRCSHVAMEMDWQPNRFFSQDGQLLLCASHGALHAPLTGACVGGPCRGGLVLIHTQERDGVIWWQAQYNLQPFNF